MFQKIIAGKNEKFLNLLRILYPEYELILPAGFDYLKHYKSIISATLVRRDVLGSYKVIELDSELPNRICYLVAILNGIDMRVINTHLVQVWNFKYQADWYVCERKRLHLLQWNLIHDDLHKNKETDVIFAGDMQEETVGVNLTRIKEDGYIISSASGAKTVKNNFFSESCCIAHIIQSLNAKAALCTTEILYDNSDVGTYSDHSLLYLCS